jgi:acetyl-CoA carboxylase biotin carboxyl carrier protein
MTRMHERRQEVAAKRDGERWILTSPGPGWFVPAVGPGDLVMPGHPIGDLEVLGRRLRLLAPNVHGLGQRGHDTPRAVGYGDVLLVLDTAVTAPGLDASATTAASATEAATGLVFRAPTSGRFYGRPAPDKPPFVSVGDELAPGPP